MNNLQKIISDICGYSGDPTGESGSKNDFYYEAKDKFEFIKDIMLPSYDFDLSKEEIERIISYLETNFEGSDQMYHAFKEIE